MSETGTTLLELGAGNGSKNEQIKLHTANLRGTIAEGLKNSEDTGISADDQQLLKFHGSYQQENRDDRAARKKAGLEKLHSFMIRARIPGGALTSAQYLAFDELAQTYGNGTFRLTTRQSIQLHGVLKGNLKPTIKRINDALLSTLAACGDVNRNVMACPAPLPHPVHAQATKLARELALALAPKTGAYHEIWLDAERVDAAVEEEEPLYGRTYLPRKFKIAVALENDNCIDAHTHDIAFVAHADGGYTVLIGGGMGSTHGKKETYPRLASPFAFVRPDEAIEVAKAILSVQRDYGDRTNRRHARMKYVVEERGVAWFRAQVEERLGRSLALPRALDFPPVDDHLAWHRQADGRWFLGVYVANGRIVDTPECRIATALREVAKRCAPQMRITAQQNLLLTGIASELRVTVESILRAHGVTVDPRALGVARGAMACPALPTCGLAVAEAERVLPSILDEIQAALQDLGVANEPLQIRMTGCPNGCARPRLGDIGIVGRSLDLYDLFIGGDQPNTRLNALYRQGVKREALVETLRPLLEQWKNERNTGEAFGDFFNRIASESDRPVAAQQA